VNRREFLAGLGATGLLAACSSSKSGRRALASSSTTTTLLPNPIDAPFDTVVVVMMENRSFDHLLGWLPGANGRQAGLHYRDPAGVRHATFPLAPTIGFQGCGNLDPDHSWEGGRIQVNGGAMDGWLRANSDEFAIGYYQRRDRPFFNELAMSFTTLDHYFSSILAETFPNRFFQHAAQTPVLHNGEVVTAQTVPTIWDSLAAAGVSGKYYFTDVPFIAVWGDKYLPIAHTYPEFLLDAAAGTLPAVSFLDPRFNDEELGTSGDDHPHADLRVGDAFMSEVFHAVASGPKWANTVFVITYDEHGGFFDHVAPPSSVAANDVDPPDDDGEVSLGVRVPTIIASPWTRNACHEGHADYRGPRIHSAIYDHTSVLKLIEWRWGLPNLTARDAPGSNITNLAHALDFRHHDPRVPSLPRPIAPILDACGPAITKRDASDQWVQLRESPVARGWKGRAIR
jgi:phospholipase C